MSLCVSLVLTLSSNLGTRIALVILNIRKNYTNPNFYPVIPVVSMFFFSIRVEHSVDPDQMALSGAS